jgi:stage V sporulation protein G
VIQEFQAELERAKQPGYVSKYDDEYPGDGSHAPSESPKAEEPKANGQPVAAPASNSHNPNPNKLDPKNHRVEAAAPILQGAHRASAVGSGATKKAPLRSKGQFGEGIF